jgi:hypothetical protein
MKKLVKMMKKGEEEEKAGDNDVKEFSWEK